MMQILIYHSWYQQVKLVTLIVVCAGHPNLETIFDWYNLENSLLKKLTDVK